MIKSMTGYGRAVETVNGREFTVELRSVNNRYLDCSVRLPRILTFGEEAVKQAVKNAVSRGKVDVFISVDSLGAEETVVKVNEPLARQYVDANGNPYKLPNTTDELITLCQKLKDAGCYMLIPGELEEVITFFPQQAPPYTILIEEVSLSA